MTPEVAVQALASSTSPIIVINYIHGGPIDDKHNSRRQRQRLLCAVSIRKHISFVLYTFAEGSVSPIDDIVTFSPINVNWVLQLHEDALILKPGVSGFDIRRILVDLSNSIDLL